MKVVNYLPYDDIGGVGYRTATAFNTLKPEWDYHAYRGAPSYLQYPEHTRWNWPAILRDWNTADVVHVNDHIPTVGRKRPTVVTFHGTGYREQSDSLLNMALGYGATVLVSTLDLWLLHPDDTQWMPQIDDLTELATYRTHNEGVLRIGHAPTNRSLKSTHEFLQACERLDFPHEVILIEGMSWRDCLKVKGTCDIIFDQTAYGYGGNAIEAWGMGIPVICGAPDNTLTEYQRRFGYLPFVEAQPDTILEALHNLTNPAERATYGAKGRSHADTFHSQQAGVNRLVPIYEATAGN